MSRRYNALSRPTSLTNLATLDFCKSYPGEFSRFALFFDGFFTLSVHTAALALSLCTRMAVYHPAHRHFLSIPVRINGGYFRNANRHCSIPGFLEIGCLPSAFLLALWMQICWKFNPWAKLSLNSEASLCALLSRCQWGHRKVCLNMQHCLTLLVIQYFYILNIRTCLKTTQDDQTDAHSGLTQGWEGHLSAGAVRPIGFGMMILFDSN